MKNEDKDLWIDDAYTFASNEGSQTGWFVLMAIVFFVIVYMVTR